MNGETLLNGTSIMPQPQSTVHKVPSSRSYDEAVRAYIWRACAALLLLITAVFLFQPLGHAQTPPQTQDQRLTDARNQAAEVLYLKFKGSKTSDLVQAAQRVIDEFESLEGDDNPYVAALSEILVLNALDTGDDVTAEKLGRWRVQTIPKMKPKLSTMSFEEAGVLSANMSMWVAEMELANALARQQKWAEAAKYFQAALEDYLRDTNDSGERNKPTDDWAISLRSSMVDTLENDADGAKDPAKQREALAQRIQEIELRDEKAHPCVDGTFQSLGILKQRPDLPEFAQRRDAVIAKTLSLCPEFRSKLNNVAK